MSVGAIDRPWAADASDPRVDDRMRRQADEVLQYYGELDRCIATTGMDGIVGLLTVSQHVAAALQVVHPQELDGVVSALRSLVERLVRMDSELQRVRALKTRLAAADEAPPALGTDRV